MQEIYRACAAIVVFREDEGVKEVLLLHKPRKMDDWQIPQGGIEEGETVQEAALREVHEEAGITPRIIGESASVYQYDFPPSYRKERPDNVCGQRINFVFAVLDAEGDPVQVDDQEIDDHRWVTPEQIGDYIVRPEYLEHVHNLIEESVALLHD